MNTTGKIENLNIEEKEKELQYYNKCINATKTLVDVAKDRKQQHEKRKKELEDEIRAENVDPEKIDEEIVNIFDELEKVMKEVSELIPFDLLKELDKLPKRD
jgi:uncharacterized FlaG/YvyC family protein